MSLDQVQILQENFTSIKQNRWLDKRLAYVLARSFVGTGRKFDYSLYQNLKSRFKANLGMFHVFHQPISDAIIVMMMVNGKTSEADVRTIIDNYKLLIDVRFSRSPYTYFSAFLLSLGLEDELETAKRALDIYFAIQKDHPWLTNAEDTPMAMLLALQPYLNQHTPQEIADITEAYYQNLKQAGFSKFADLQYAAACCTNYFGAYVPEVLTEMNKIVRELRNQGFKISSNMYISIITLTYASLTQPLDFAEIVENERLIKESGNLRFDPSVRQLLAISLYTGKLLHRGQSGQANQLDALNMSVMIMQEQAAIIAATTAAVVASSNSH